MTHVIYSHQQLQHKSIAGLRQLYDQIGCTVEITNRYCKNAWIAAIADYQAQRLYKIAPLALDEQTLAQAELDNYIANQAQAIAPEELTTQQINPHHFEVYAGNRLVAYISYDNNEYVTQRWVVMVNGEEKFRHFAISQCHRFINWHHKDGTLNPPAQTVVPEVPKVQEISLCDQELVIQGEQIASIEFDHDNYQDLYWRIIINGREIYRDTTPAKCHSYVKQQYQQGMLPVQAQFEEPSATANEIIARLGDEEELTNLQPVEVIQKNGEFWFVAVSLKPQPVADDSMGASGEDCLDMPFDQLTPDEWLTLIETEAPSSELVAA
ncbi:hypothetical protein [Anabaena azotica]|uniref:Uncharacterized protein n=1 Tax=Anabaena azotica FACHB-119 TaxID=947527 RepID=A0ABR8DEB8_9NOST|nr:hypothetical protein [Anabaena azotica]MBD2505585.1 hypothetical protein [Anabaena azotica FACHB-119]